MFLNPSGKLLVIFLSVLLTISCTVRINHTTFSNKASFLISRTVAKYYSPHKYDKLTLKRNQYFKICDHNVTKFFDTKNIYIGRYIQKNDTLYLDWLDVKSPYKSHLAVFDTTRNRIYLLEDQTNYLVEQLYFVINP